MKQAMREGVRVTTQCQAVAKSGSPCKVPPIKAGDGRFCLYHSPQTISLRRAASQRGGRNKATVARIRKHLPEALTAGELAEVLTQLLDDIKTGETDTKVAQAMASVARVLLEAQRIAAEPELTQLQAQMVELRSQIDQRAELVA